LTNKTKAFGKSAREIFGVNYQRLANLKVKYDPDDIFGKFSDLLSDA
jgi:hypothetical protein